MPSSVLATVGWSCATPFVAINAVGALNSPSIATPVFVHEVARLQCLNSHRRHQPIPTRARIKLAAALALDGGAAGGGRCVLRKGDGAGEAVGAAADLAGGV